MDLLKPTLVSLSLLHLPVTHFRCRPMSVPGLSLLGLKRIRGFVSILRSINPTIIVTVNPCDLMTPLKK